MRLYRLRFYQVGTVAPCVWFSSKRGARAGYHRINDSRLCYDFVLERVEVPDYSPRALLLMALNGGFNDLPGTFIPLRAREETAV